MRILPRTKDEWVGLILFPFKAYVVLAIPFYILFNAFFPRPFTGTGAGGETLMRIIGYYVLCAPPLLVGSVIQFFVCKRTHATRTLFFLIPPVLIILWIVLPLVTRGQRDKNEVLSFTVSYDEVVKRLDEMQQQGGEKWKCENKQEAVPGRNYSFVILERQSDANLRFYVTVKNTGTNTTTVYADTVKFGASLNKADLMTESNRISEITKAIQGKP
jgi:hypothetical protein